jgi:hypothetical protein
MSEQSDSEPSYEIGRGRPPRHTQFKKGQSGNRAGRPKGSKNFATVIESELKRRIIVTEDGRRKKITKREAVAKQLVNKAASGDSKAIPVLLNESRQQEAGFATGPGMEVLSRAEDQLVMVNIVRRIREVQNLSPEHPPEAADSGAATAPSALGDEGT